MLAASIAFYLKESLTGSFWISHFSRSTAHCAALLGSAIPRHWEQQGFVLIPGAGEGAFDAPSVPSCVLGQHGEQDGTETSQENTNPGEQSRVTSLPLAKAKPPPSRNTMFHGIFSWTVFQSSRAGGARNLVLPSGTQKRFCEATLRSPEKGEFGGSWVWSEYQNPFCQQTLELSPEANAGSTINKSFKTWLAKL